MGKFGVKSSWRDFESGPSSFLKHVVGRRKAWPKSDAKVSAVDSLKSAMESVSSEGHTEGNVSGEILSFVSKDFRFLVLVRLDYLLELISYYLRILIKV